MAAAFLLIAAALQAATPAAADADFCESARGNQTRLAPRLPLTTGETRLDAFTPDCARRILVWDRAFVGDPALLDRGWRERHQIWWNQTVCEIERFHAAAIRGWQFISRVQFPNGSRQDFLVRCD